MRRLHTDRYLVLTQQLIEEHGSRNAAAKVLGVSPGYLTKLQREEHRDVGLDAIRRAREALSLGAEFFEDRTLGPEPDYREHVLHRRREGERRPALEDFLDSYDPDDPRRPTDEEVTWLEGHSFRELRSAGLEVTPSLYDRLLRERRAQLAGKLTAAPALEPPEPRPGRRKVRRR